MGVYTKTGDAGQTGLYTGERIAKDSLRVEAYGSVDESNAALAMARAFCQKQEVVDWLCKLQKNNGLLMADLASQGAEPLLTMELVQGLERAIDAMEAGLPPLTHFLVPGDTRGGAMLDMARTLVRRAERRLLALHREEPVAEVDRVYLNRLSDFCFMLMRLEEAS